MEPENFFLVLEGLDGSGKTEISRQLAHHIKSTLPSEVYLTFEPHEPSCAGIFIRQVLTKRIKKFSHRTLALAFAANRLDHSDRRIDDFLSQGEHRIAICDRYRMSSLVYQSCDQIPMQQVMDYNEDARVPNLTIFLDTKKTICYERMKRRAQNKELFERKLGETRVKYDEAITMLKDRGENIVLVEANGDISQVLKNVLNVLNEHGPDWLDIPPGQLALPHFEPQVFSLNGSLDLRTEDCALRFSHYWNQGPIVGADAFRTTLTQLTHDISDTISQMSANELGLLFLDSVRLAGYQIGEQLAWSDLDAFDVDCVLPLGLVQRGSVLFIGEAQRLDVILKKAETRPGMSDFFLVFAPFTLEPLTPCYERGQMTYTDRAVRISPNTKLFGRRFIVQSVLSVAVNMLREEHFYTLCGLPHLNEVLADFMAGQPRDP